MPVDKTFWSNAHYSLCKEMDSDGLPRYGEVDEFVAGLTEAEVKSVADALKDTDPFAPCYMTRLDQYRARQKAAGSVETAFVAGHDGLAKAVQATVEANRQGSI